MRRLPLALQLLIGAASVSLLLVLPGTLLALWRAQDWHPLPLAAVTALLELLRVEIVPGTRNERTSFTLGSLGLFLVLSLHGPDWAVAATAFHSVLTAVRLRSPWFKALYNVGTVTSAMALVGFIITWGTHLGTPWLQAILFAAAIAAHVFLNTGSVALAVALAGRRPLIATWRDHFAWVSLQQLILAATGAALGHAVAQMGWTALLLASPLVLLRATYQSYIRSQGQHTREVEQFANQLITTLAAVVDARDAYTFGHSAQVAQYAVAMGERLGYNQEQLERLRVGALLHDIGKVGIPESILFKPEKLEPWEYDLMKEHATIGHRIVSQIERLKFAADIIHQHHEWFNGRGYPRGLRGGQILPDARIVGVADALESMMSDRPYRPGRSLSEAMAEIQRCAGTQFDPQVVLALEQVIQDRGQAFFVNSATLVDVMHARVAAAAGWQQRTAAGKLVAATRSHARG